jgi:predicted transcriptional regulator
VTAALTQQEISIAERLCSNGLARATASLAVVMATREHSRPESELVDIVRQYQWLEPPEAAREAVLQLKQRQWLVERSSYVTVHQNQLGLAVGLFF